MSAYADAAIALDTWMTAEDVDGDFTVCDTKLLNRFFAAYHDAHGQGGTNTKQRNLRHLFSWLECEHDHPHPYTDDLQRYTPAKTRPSTLAGQFITDLFDVTGNGRARGFEDARDHAMIHMLTEGVRRTELIQLQTTDLPVDVIAQPFVRVVPLKGARGSADGRIVPLAPATAVLRGAPRRDRCQRRGGHDGAAVHPGGAPNSSVPNGCLARSPVSSEPGPVARLGLVPGTSRHT